LTLADTLAIVIIISTHQEVALSDCTLLQFFVWRQCQLSAEASLASTSSVRWLPPHHVPHLPVVTSLLIYFHILWWEFNFDSFYVRVSTMTAIKTVGHRLRSTPTNGHRFTALGLPWRSPVQVLTEVNIAYLQWTCHWASLGHHSKPKTGLVILFSIVWWGQVYWSIFISWGT